MDYKKWISDTDAFVREFARKHPKARTAVEVKQPATTREIHAVESETRTRIPKPLKSFIETASSGVYFGATYTPATEDALSAFRTLIGKHYYKQFSMGTDGLLHLEHIPHQLERCNNTVENWLDYGVQPALLPKRPFPIIDIANGDNIAVDLAVNEGQSEVFLLSHEDEASPKTVIAKDFDSFLLSWQAVLYVDPSYAEFEWFIDRKGHKLSPAGPPTIAALTEFMSTHP